MDFRYSEEQTLVRDLAREILDKEVTLERLKAVDAATPWFDAALWRQLAEANLLGLVTPEDLGGMGFGVEEICMLLQESGRVLAPVPVFATLMLGALPIAERGSKRQQEAWLPAVASGDAILTAALVDAGSDDPARPATRAVRDGEHWVLSGAKRLVPSADLARRILVPARNEAGLGVFLVDPSGPGVTRTAHRSSNGDFVFDLALDDARVDAGDVLGDDPAAGVEAVRRLHECALVGTCALQIGVSERALEITAAYVTERTQFKVPIGSFQAVQHRCADAYIDLQAMRWTAWQAASRLGGGLACTREAVVAKFWAAEGGSRIADTCQHVHGGAGADLDYPIHRHFLWSKFLELQLGSATPQLHRLGRDMAERPPQEFR